MADDAKSSKLKSRIAKSFKILFFLKYIQRIILIEVQYYKFKILI
jgi:hypothetical protein